MKRHAFMIDLLRPGNNDDQLLNRYLSRSEYTEDDYNTIIEVAERVKKLAEFQRIRFGL